MTRQTVDIDQYAMGWDQFLYTAFAFAKADRWDEFDQVEFVYKGEVFDPACFVANLQRLMNFASMATSESTTVPLTVLREIPIDRKWVGFINIGANRLQQTNAVKQVKQMLRDNLFVGTPEYFMMLPEGVNGLAPRDAEPSPSSRQHILIFAFDSEEDLVVTKLNL